MAKRQSTATALMSGLLGGIHASTTRATTSAADSIRFVTGTLRARCSDLLELRMTRWLNSVHIPTSRDIHELSARVEQLSRELKALRAGAQENPPRKKRRAAKNTNGRAA